MNSTALIKSKLLSSLSGLSHGFTTRTFGDMRIGVKRESFLQSVNLDHGKLAWSKQTHGSKIYEVKVEELGKEIIGFDALISLNNSQHKPILGVHVADCVPLLFVDPITKITAVAHAGWKGTLSHIAKKVVDKMIVLGAKPNDILAVIGPHIGENCYDVPETRVELFRKEFNQPVDIIKDEKHYLNLSLPNFTDLVASGIKPEHIEISKNCTHCDLRLYSFRRDTKQTFGEMLGFIAYAD